jgi:signal transduction histidine kinase
MLTDGKSLVAQLGWRLAAVLSVATLMQLGWLFYHFRGADALYGAGSLQFALFDFFVDTAWMIPLIGIVTFLVCAAGLRRRIAPLKELSARAASINPRDTYAPLPLEQVPTELRPLVASVNTGFERLIEAFDVQQRFAANAAHELRNPLAVLQAGLERLPESTDVGALRHEVRRTGRIVQQLLSLARLEGNGSVAVQRLELVPAVREIIEQMTPLASASRATLALEYDVDQLNVPATPEALEEILRNLVENALSHAPSGSEVTVTLTKDRSLTVADNGAGIPEIERAHVFERFWRGAWTKSPGSGLGLAIVQEACRRIGATASCQANPTGGSLFTITFAA